MAIREEKRRVKSKTVDIILVRLPQTDIMQRAPLAILYGLDYREPIQWPLEKRREG